MGMIIKPFCIYEKKKKTLICTRISTYTCVPRLNLLCLSTNTGINRVATSERRHKS